MNMPDPQAMTKEWMAQISDPNHWKTWFNMAPQPASNPLAGILQDAGASIKPEAIEQLKNAYVAKLTGLWADFMAGKARRMRASRRNWSLALPGARMWWPSWTANGR